MKVCIFLADGFEEVEALAPLDLLRRAGFDVTSVSIKDSVVTGAHGIRVIADKTASEVSYDSFDAVILPGGMPGAKNLDSSDFVDKTVRSVHDKGGKLAAICAAPMVLGHKGILQGKKATCFPGFEDDLIGAEVLPLPVVTDGNITTANGMESAILFGKELVLRFSDK